MLSTPDNLLFLHLLVDDLPDNLLHHLSWDRGEADRPVVPWVLLLALFEDWSDKYLLISLIPHYWSDKYLLISLIPLRFLQKEYSAHC